MNASRCARNELHVNYTRLEGALEGTANHTEQPENGLSYAYSELLV